MCGMTVVGRTRGLKQERWDLEVVNVAVSCSGVGIAQSSKHGRV